MSIHPSQMEFDFSRSPPVPAILPPRRAEVDRLRRRSRGEMSYFAGLAAEEGIARDYERRGYPLLRRRWRGRSGEIDLIFRDGAGFVFVEVKASWSFDQALEHLRCRQIRRLQKSAEEFVGTQPLGALSEMRFDVALMDRHGLIRVIEKAFGP
ncbi:YraN family protein [Yangia mangrovi]|uniref:UPF0102 protein CLG85_025550 n=2 Tax=Alloyangia mangrovi TaxID=1779329 RepID=A0A2A3JP47_9RHOB|nr:YraN family protein [Alloyangia mangrovi]